MRRSQLGEIVAEDSDLFIGQRVECVTLGERFGRHGTVIKQRKDKFWSVLWDGEDKPTGWFASSIFPIRRMNEREQGKISLVTATALMDWLNQ